MFKWGIKNLLYLIFSAFANQNFNFGFKLINFGVFIYVCLFSTSRPRGEKYNIKPFISLSMSVIFRNGIETVVVLHLNPCLIDYFNPRNSYI